MWKMGNTLKKEGTWVNKGVAQTRGRGRGSPTGGGTQKQGRMLFVHHPTLCPPFACPSVHKGGGDEQKPRGGVGGNCGAHVPPVLCTCGKGGNSRGCMQGGGCTNWRGHAQGRGTNTPSALLAM